MLVFRGRRFYLIYFLIVFISTVVVFAGIIHSSSTTSGIAIAKEIIRNQFDTNARIHQLLNLTILTQPSSIVSIGSESKIASPPQKARLPDPSELGVFELCGSTGRHYEQSTTSGRDEVVRVVHMSWKSTALPPRFAFYQKSWCDCFPRWRHFLWTDADNERLVQLHYSWFYEKYRSFDKNIFRIDSVRYLYATSICTGTAASTRISTMCVCGRSRSCSPADLPSRSATWTESGAKRAGCTSRTRTYEYSYLNSVSLVLVALNV